MSANFGDSINHHNNTKKDLEQISPKEKKDESKFQIIKIKLFYIIISIC